VTLLNSNAGDVLTNCIRASDTLSCPANQSRLRIGDLEAGEQATVTLWTTISPNELSADALTLIHAGGVGAIQVMVLMNRRWERASRFAWPAALFVFAAVIGWSTSASERRALRAEIERKAGG
jgi:hypothetical protein